MSTILDLSSYQPGPGVTLIEASAGTGKTYSIANLYLHFILQEKRVSEILVVTFTEAATKEIRDRVRQNLSTALLNDGSDPTITAILAQYDNVTEKLERAILNFDQAAIFTIHGFCQRMLQENAFESLSLFDTELAQDTGPLIERIVFDFWRQITHASDDKPALNQDQLTGLARKLLNKSDMRIIDEVVTPELITVAQKQFDLFAEKCLSTLDLLETCQEEVDDLMFNGKPLNGVSYKANMFEKKWAELDNCLRTPKQTIKILNYFGGDIEVKVAKGKPAPQHELFDRCAELAEMEIPDLLALKAQKIKTDFMQFMISESEKIKAELNIMTFDDLINTLHKVLQNEAGSGPLHQRIRDKYKIALVDEFQDTDPIQYQVFSSLFGNKQHCSEHAFYMIGDPKQSIYRFRGADIFAYLEAKQHADQQLTLDTNYRSEPKMVDAVNQFFMAKGSEEAFAYAPEENQQGICFEPVKSGADKAILNLGSETEALQLRWVIPNTEDPDKEESKTNIAKLMPKLVTREIVDILNKSQDQQAYFSKSDQSTEAVKPGDIAILVNSHRQAQEMKSRLNQARIPVVIQKSGNVFDSAQAKDLLRLLEAISDPRDRTITPLLLSSFFSFSAASLKAMSDETRFTFLKEFIDYQKFWESRGLLRTLQKFMDRHELYTSSLAKENGERIISNLFQIRELLHEEETLNGLGLTGLIRYLNEKITSSDKDDERYLQRLETDANAVQILTIHKSKGLEFPIVFCPYMWNQNYDVSTSHLFVN